MVIDLGGVLAIRPSRIGDGQGKWSAETARRTGAP